MRIRPIGPDDLREAMALSVSAGWNQDENDWSMMFSLGRGWGIEADDAEGRRRLAASIVTLPYGSDFAWVSMVLVLPAFRRRGYAVQLLRHALADLTADGRAAVLDATPAGRAVYLEAGFADHWSFRRYRREAHSRFARDDEASSREAASAIGSRPLEERDWHALAAFDRPAFGADRTPLLRILSRRLPQAARVVERNGEIVGFSFGREGREAVQIGPLLARDQAIARRLLEDVLDTIDDAVYLDLADRHDALLEWLQARGFVFQRPFTRMVNGAPMAPGDATPIVLVAGPELG